MLTLPEEVIRYILLFVPYSTLKIVCLSVENKYLRCIMENFIYEKVHFGATCMKNIHNVTLDELKKLEAGEINATVHHLVLTPYQILGPSYYPNEFLDFAIAHKDFFQRIRRVEFYGPKETYEQFQLFLPFENIERMNLYKAQEFSIDMLPPNILKLCLSCDSIASTPNASFPASLIDLNIMGIEDTFNVLLPRWLKLLTCQETQFTGGFPEGLQKLSITTGKPLNVSQIRFPAELVDLKLACCQIDRMDLLAQKLPATLKVLNLRMNPVHHLGGIKFPPRLEVLDLLYCCISTMDGAEFPGLLKELYLGHNELYTLGLLELPDLRVLDISVLPRTPFDITSLAHVQLPSQLDTLVADGQPIADWSTVDLPISLRSMNIEVLGKIDTLRLPGNLRDLTILFENLMDAQYSSLTLPISLESLKLRYGVLSVFDWKLPILTTLVVEEFIGPISVPKSVESLTLISKHKLVKEQKELMNVELPPYIQKLTISCPLTLFPDTLVDLEILNFITPDKVEFPPRLERLRLCTSEMYGIRGDLLDLPDSLHFLCGRFLPLPRRPPNLRDDHEYLWQGAM